MKLTLLLALTVMLSACATTRETHSVDGSNARTTKGSIERIMRTLNRAQRQAFIFNLVEIQFSDSSPEALIERAIEFERLDFAKLGEIVSGLTHAEIKTLADKSNLQITPINEASR